MMSDSCALSKKDDAILPLARAEALIVMDGN